MSRGQRRLLVAGVCLGLIFYPGIPLVFDDSWWLLLSIAGVVATVAIHSWLLAPFTQRIADRKEIELDERQEAVRNRAHRTAYQILGAVVLTALLYLQIDLQYFDGRLWSPDMTAQNMTSVLGGTIWLIITLPTSIIAWNEPDPDEGGGA